MKLIVGLGNPGKEYEHTRHNVGFLVIDALINNGQLATSKARHSRAEVSKGLLEKKRVLLVKPQTFMNESGHAVRALLGFFKRTPADLIVIHDDKDIPLGETRVQRARGAAGHNGVQSLIDQLATNDFWRIRVGVASPLLAKEGRLVRRSSESEGGGVVNTADFVLGKFTKEEQKTLEQVINHVVNEIKKLLIQE